MSTLDFLIKNHLLSNLILLSIFVIALLWCVLDYFNIIHTDTPLERALKQLEQERKEHIKWQANRNLAAKKRKQAIFDLIDNFDYRNITVDYTSDRFYVIIKIHKDALMERKIE